LQDYLTLYLEDTAVENVQLIQWIPSDSVIVSTRCQVYIYTDRY